MRHQPAHHSAGTDYVKYASYVHVFMFVYDLVFCVANAQCARGKEQSQTHSTVISRTGEGDEWKNDSRGEEDG